MIIKEFEKKINNIDLFKISSDSGLLIARVDNPDIHFEAIINTNEKTQLDMFIEIEEEQDLTPEETDALLSEVF